MYQSTKWQDVDGVRVKYFPYVGYVHYNFSPSLFRELLKSVAQYNLVHITAVWNFPVLAASLACRFKGVPYVISPRGTIYPETIALKSTLFKKVYYRLFARSCLNHARAIHYTAADEHQKVSQYLKLKPEAWVIPNGIEIREFKKIAPSALAGYRPLAAHKPYLLFMGRISRKKGLDILVKAFRILAAQFPQLQLVIAGPDEEGYLAEVIQMVEKEALMDRVVFTGMLKGEEKLLAYQQAKVFVLSSYSENFGMSVVEAMACGTPVVISDQVGIHGDIGRHQAGVVTQTNAESVAAGVRSLLENPRLCDEMALAGQKFVESHYEISAVARMFINSYQKL
jgi:glycosyltransferase involved in cell wall biosynthesis